MNTIRIANIWDELIPYDMCVVGSMSFPEVNPNFDYIGFGYIHSVDGVIQWQNPFTLEVWKNFKIRNTYFYKKKIII